METVFIDGAVLQYIDLIRVALSEEDNTQRLRAIKNVKHDVVAKELELLMDEGDGDCRTQRFGVGPKKAAIFQSRSSCPQAQAAGQKSSLSNSKAALHCASLARNRARQKRRQRS